LTSHITLRVYVQSRSLLVDSVRDCLVVDQEIGMQIAEHHSLHDPSCRPPRQTKPRTRGLSTTYASQDEEVIKVAKRTKYKGPFSMNLSTASFSPSKRAEHCKLTWPEEAALLRNHGLLTVYDTVEEAVF